MKRSIVRAGLLVAGAFAFACGGSTVGEDAGEETAGDGTSGEGATAEGDGDGDGTSGDGDGTEPADVDACDGATLYERPADPAERGPWPIGVRTSMVDDIVVEVWYPAQWGSQAGVAHKVYDPREQLPPSEVNTIPDDDIPYQDCDCYPDLPLDSAHGPYPVVLFIHGTAGFRTQSLTQMEHWASRGFVVVAGDYPGLKLAHQLAILCPDSGGSTNLSGDTDKILAAVTAADGDFAFLSGGLQLDRLAIAGHSAGANAAADATGKPGVRVVIPMAGGSAANASATLEESLHLGGTVDMVVSYNQNLDGYNGSAAPKQFVGLENAGHLAFSELCSMQNDQGQDIVEIGQEHGVCGTVLGAFLFDCDDAYLPDPTGWEIINYATTTVLEARLQCRTDGPDLSQIQSVYPDVSEHRGE